MGERLMRQLCRNVLVLAFLLCLVNPAATRAAGAAPKKLSDAQIFAVLSAANTGEIDAANLAQQKSGNSDVKAFADDMIKDHTQMQSDAQALAERLNIKPEDSSTSTELKAGSEKEMIKLRSVIGPTFDKDYVAAQVADHTKVLQIFDRQLLPGATNEELRALLNKARPIIAEHLQHAKTLLTQLRKGKVPMGENP
jgi:putative membrane protein